MNRDSLKALSVALIAIGVLLGGAYMWGVSTIIADTTPPEIDEGATTSGALAYGDGKPKVTLYVEENLGMQEAKAELYHVNLIGTRGTLYQRCTMAQAGKSGTTYKYLGSFTVTLEQNKEYILLYTATDSAGHKDTYETRIKLVAMEAEVWVNDHKVEGAGSTVYVTSLQVAFKVVVTQGAGNLDKVYCVVGSDTVDNFQRTYEGYGIENWVGSYTLPGDGSYEFVVIVRDLGGTNTQLATFTVELGGAHQTELIIAVFAVLAAAGLYMYVKPQETRKR